MLVALAGARAASAQTVANLKIVSGDGQVMCQCISATLAQFQPITVQALDINQQPVAHATLNWKVASFVGSPVSLAGILEAPRQSLTTQTDSNGMSTVPISEVVTIGTGTVTLPYYQSVIQVSANNGSPAVTFTETVSLVDQSGSAMVQAVAPYVNTSSGYVPIDQIDVTGNAGSTFFPPFQMFVGGEGLASSGVQGVSMRLLSLQANPTITCAPGANPGDPGTNLSGPSFNANPPLNVACAPVLSGSGTGEFVILVGGVPPSDPTLSLANWPDVEPCGQGGPCALQTLGPYTFTSVAGTPTAVQLIQGDGQTTNPGQSLGTLIAKLVDAKGNGVPGVAIQWIANPPGAVAIATQQTTTDNNGEVAAKVSFSGAASGLVTITVQLASNPSVSATFKESATVFISSLKAISGDAQTAPAGAAFSLPLQVQLEGPSNNLVSNYPVQFAVTSGNATLSALSAYTNGNGIAQVNVTAGITTGTVTVRASVGVLSQTFTLTVVSAGPTPTGIVKISGDTQSAATGTSFNAPLVVQVNSASGPVGNYTVLFSASSNATLSANSAITNAAGQAQVLVTAGASTGTATVTASIAGYSATFNLTINPPGPTGIAFLNGASGQPNFISPCSIATLTAAGLAPNGAASMFPAPIFGALPTQVNGLSVLFNNVAAPIISETTVNGQSQVTLQVPCETPAGASIPVTVNVGGGSANPTVPVQALSPGIFQTTYPDGVARAVVLRSDGSFATLLNPARRGEIVRIYATGLGATVPVVGTNSVDDPDADLLGDDAKATGNVFVSVNGVGANVVTTRLAANLIGVFEIEFIVPANAQQGNDVAVALTVTPAGTTTQVNALNSKIPVQ